MRGFRPGVFLLILMFGAGRVSAQPPPPPPDAPKPKPDTQPPEIPPFTETVIVTAARSDQALINTSASVTVVSARQIEASGGTTYAEILRGVPGLNVVQIGSRDVNVNTRSPTGRLANSQLVLIDGRSIYLDFFGVVFWDALPAGVDAIKQIEIVRSPGSAVWGANALTGVINIRTKSPADVQGAYLAVGAGERGTREIEGRVAGVSGRVGYLFSGGYSQQDPFARDNTLPGGAPFPAGYAFTNEGTKQPKADARVDWSMPDGGRWSYRGGYAGFSGLIHTGLGPFSLDSGAYTSYAEAGYTRGSVDAKAYWNHLHANSRNVLFPLHSFAHTDTFVGEAIDHRAIGFHQAIGYGVSARTNRFSLTIAPGQRSRTDAGAFVQDDIFVNDRVTVNLGARVDKFSTLSPAFSPRTGLVWKVTSRHALRAAFNRAFRAPSLLENFASLQLPNAIPLDPNGPPFVFISTAIGDRGLKPETAKSFEAGYTGALGRRSTVSATAYRTSITDNIRFFPVAFYGPADPPAGWPLPAALVPALPKTFTFLNIGNVRTQGIELAAQTSWSRTLWTDLSYTWQAEPKLIDASTTLPLQLNRPPRHQASASIGYKTDRWRGAMSGAYTGSAFWSDVLDSRFWGDTDAFFQVNGSAGVMLPNRRAEIAVRGANLLNRRIKQHVFGDIISRRVVAELRVWWKRS